MELNHVCSVVRGLGYFAEKANSRAYAVMTVRERALIARLNGVQSWEDLDIRVRFQMIKSFSDGFYQNYADKRMAA